jgi:hypothetical protein
VDALPDEQRVDADSIGAGDISEQAIADRQYARPRTPSRRSKHRS